MEQQNINFDYKTQIIAYFKDNTKRVITCAGRRDYTFAKALIIDIEGSGENILKVETHIL